ncbi:MAG: sigma-54-dependent Fis family transcriptional regulator, partial [Nitrospinae bacterium]|nr:sigma-54-dependent Fis family transcriptional regulator [Nitrospinota bacterium]
MKESVVIVDPEKSMSRPTKKFLQACGIKVKVFGEEKLALEKISPKWSGILLTHFDTLVARGMKFLAKVKQLDPDLPVLMVLDHTGIPLVVSAMRMGAYDVIQKPFSNKDILKIILGALEKRRLVLENRRRQSEIGTREKPESFVAGRSPIMKRLNETMRRAGKVDAEVLLVGESGTGKKLIARCLHEQSPRRHKNFIA